MNLLDKTPISDPIPTPVGRASARASQSHDNEISKLNELIRSQEIKIQALIQEVAYLRRIRYGVKSEAMTADQLRLFDEKWRRSLPLHNRRLITR